MADRFNHIPRELIIDKLYEDTNYHRSPGEFYGFFTFKRNDSVVRLPNAAGFRFIQGIGDHQPYSIAILFTNSNEPEWPDAIDREIGEFSYYGDNRHPGKALSERRGNRFLEHLETLKRTGTSEARKVTPPVLGFQKVKKGNKSYMQFLGLMSLKSLVAEWRIIGGNRFQNYKAIFTILKEQTIQREWLENLVSEGLATPQSISLAPLSWQKWVDTGNAIPLTSTSREIRKEDDTLLNKKELKLLTSIRALSSRDFEYLSAGITTLLSPSVRVTEITRPVSDGGQDFWGLFRIGEEPFAIELKFHGEAKNKKTIGVREVARLIARIRNKEFGIFVTSGYYSLNIQKEILEDNHPIMLLSGKDICKILLSNHKIDENGCIDIKWLKTIQEETYIS